MSSIAAWKAMRETLESILKQIVNSPKRAIALVVVVAVVALTVIAVHTLNQYNNIGGLELAQYCNSYGFSTNSESSCSSRVDLNRACNWQYASTNLVLKFESDDPYTGFCYDPQGKQLGGIREMSGYCKSIFPRSTTVKAAVANRTWVCQASIDMNLACNWEYQKNDLTARDDDENWNCYERTFNL